MARIGVVMLFDPLVQVALTVRDAACAVGLRA